MTMNGTAPQTTTFTVTGTDAIEDFLSGAYSGMRLHCDTDQPWFRHRRTDAGAFTLNTVEQSATLNFRVTPLHTIHVTRMITGRFQRTCRDADQCYAAGDLFIGAYPDQRYTAQWLPGEMTTSVLDPAQLARVAATAPGRRPQPIRFTHLDPTTPAAAAYWWATRCYVAGLLDNPETAAAPLLVANAAQLLATTTLTTFANTALTDPTIADRHDATPTTLRRAIAFIDDNATSDISVADIAAAANASIRTIQLAFRRHLDTTPMAHLRRARLDHAHRHLLAADPATTTVSATAARYGFANHSRFTATYHATYGVLPSSTLHER